MVSLTSAGYFSRRNGNADRADRPGIIDNCAVVLQEMKIPRCFERLEPDEQVRLAFGHDRGEDLVPEPHLRQHAAAPLRHAVHLALLHVQPGQQRRLGDDLAREQHALPAHAADKNIENVHDKPLKIDF